jgi:hypothetical protein
MELYINTIEIVGGILTPVGLILLIKLGIELSQERRARNDARRAKYEKEAPFDTNAEFYEVPNPKMVGVRLKKNGAVVYEGAVWKEAA